MEELTALQEAYYHLGRGEFPLARAIFKAESEREDAHRAQAYIGLLLADCNLRQENLLPELPEKLSSLTLFQKAKECASAGYLKTLEEYEKAQSGAFERKEALYTRLCESMEKTPACEEDVKTLLGISIELRGYKDAPERRAALEEQMRKLEEEKKAKKKKRLVFIIPAAVILLLLAVLLFITVLFPKRAGISYSLTPNGYTVISIDQKIEEFKTPQKINGIPVTDVDPRAFDGHNGLREFRLNNVAEYLVIEGVAYLHVEDGYRVVLAETSLREVIIPEKIEGIPVTGIGDDAFRDHFALEKVVLPQSVRVIGEKAFSNCENLSQVSGLEGVVKVSRKAFNDCKSLKELYFSQNADLARTAFTGCKNLEVFKGGLSYDFDVNADKNG